MLKGVGRLLTPIVLLLVIIGASLLILWAMRSTSGTTTWVPAVRMPAGLPSRRSV